ncbi:MAG: HEAT repeat domain-containing protein, partial [Planctomycetota bacterium]|nr:HEAT repeat domain-containing protein [Planctomycetota bacterium]
MATLPQKPTSQMGRDALLVHGLAVVAAVAAVSVAAYLGLSSEVMPDAAGVGLAAMVTLGGWSIVLAVRALRNSERATWPVTVIVLTVLEISTASLLLWGDNLNWLVSEESVHWAVSAGLPVFVPVFLIASLIAALVTWWRVRCTAAPVGRPAGAPATPSRRRWKRILAWYCALTVLGVAILLPCPLFLFCAYTRGYYWGWERDDPDWRARVVKHMPVAVGEASAAMLPVSSWMKAAEAYRYVLSSGRVFRTRLQRELRSMDQDTQLAAFAGLAQSDLPAALDCAEKIGNGDTQGRQKWLIGMAGGVFGEHAGAERIRPFLDAAQTPSLDFLGAMLRGLRGGNRTDFVPDLQRLCEADSPGRGVALQALANLLKPQDVERLWPAYLADTDPLRRKQAIEAIRYMRDVNARLSVVAAGLESPDLSLRLGIIQSRNLVSSGTHPNSLVFTHNSYPADTLTGGPGGGGNMDPLSAGGAAWLRAEFTDAELGDKR